MQVLSPPHPPPHTPPHAPQPAHGTAECVGSNRAKGEGDRLSSSPCRGALPPQNPPLAGTGRSRWIAGLSVRGRSRRRVVRYFRTARWAGDGSPSSSPPSSSWARPSVSASSCKPWISALLLLSLPLLSSATALEIMMPLQWMWRESLSFKRRWQTAIDSLLTTAVFHPLRVRRSCHAELRAGLCASERGTPGCVCACVCAFFLLWIVILCWEARAVYAHALKVWNGCPPTPPQTLHPPNTHTHTHSQPFSGRTKINK